MKWVNKQEQLKAIAKAVGCTLATVLLLLLWIMPGLRLQSGVIKPSLPHVVDAGSDIMIRFGAPVDSTLKRIGAQYLSYCIAADSLKPGEKLYRISVCKNLSPGKEFLSTLQKNGCQFYWKEVGQNKDYRIIYCTAGQMDESALQAKFKSARRFPAGSRMVIEKVIANSPDLMALDSII